MRIIIKWLPQAITLLDNIYRFYSEKSQTAAIRLYNRLLDSAEPLRVFPQAGPIEPLLKGSVSYTHLTLPTILRV